MNAPLISISLGNSAVFLIGGQSKTIKPIPIMLKSGDLVVMSGQARLAFHGVPKILKDLNIDQVFKYTHSDYAAASSMSSQYFVSDEEWFELNEYIGINRINLNIRQVN